MAQMAATHCLSIFFEHIIKQGYSDLFNYLCPKMIALYIKSRCEYCDFTRSLTMLLQACGIKYFVGCLTELFKKLTKIVKNKST